MNSIPRNATEYRAWWAENTTAPYGECWCLCGQQTQLAPTTNIPRCLFKGEPKRFVRYHGRRSSNPYFVVVDCGYYTPCWLWQHAVSKYGYATSWHDGRKVRTHKQYYEAKYGPVPAGLYLDHLCSPFGGPRHCVNPDHIEPVTPNQNARRGRNAKLTEENVKAIRQMLAQGLSQPDIASHYGVVSQTISDINRGKLWKGV